MPLSPPVACKVCSSGDCKNKEHAAPETGRLYDKFRKANDPVAREYHLAKWLKHFRPTVLAFNSQCQRMIDGKQCQKPAGVVHHLVSPRDVHSRFYDPSNVVASCTEHHAGGQKGTSPDERWAPTRWYNGQQFPHTDSFGQPIIPDHTPGTGIDNWLKVMQNSSPKPTV